jgi:hypothetical protein
MLQKTLDPRRLDSMLFGLAEVVDGVIRLITLGHVHTRLPINQSLAALKRGAQRAKAQRLAAVAAPATPTSEST